MIYEYPTQFRYHFWDLRTSWVVKWQAWEKQATLLLKTSRQYEERDNNLKRSPLFLNGEHNFHIFFLGGFLPSSLFLGVFLVWRFRHLDHPLNCFTAKKKKGLSIKHTCSFQQWDFNEPNMEFFMAFIWGSSLSIEISRCQEYAARQEMKPGAPSDRVRPVRISLVVIR